MSRKRAKSKEVNKARKEARQARLEKRNNLAKTKNGKSIARTMIDEKVKGDYRDYVIIVGDQLIDWKKTMTLRATGENTVRVEKPYLVHKSKLKNIISEDAAASFWHPVFGRLVDTPLAKTSKKGKK